MPAKVAKNDSFPKSHGTALMMEASECSTVKHSLYIPPKRLKLRTSKFGVQIDIKKLN